MKAVIKCIMTCLLDVVHGYLYANHILPNSLHEVGYLLTSFQQLAHFIRSTLQDIRNVIHQGIHTNLALRGSVEAERTQH